MENTPETTGERAVINRSRFFLCAVVIAVLNPIFSGLILGLFMLSEPTLRKEGRIVMLFAVAWGLIVMLLLAKYRNFLTL